MTAIPLDQETRELLDGRNSAELIEDPQRSLSKTLSHKYLGEDPPPEPDEVRRLAVRVRPQKVNVFSA